MSEDLMRKAIQPTPECLTEDRLRSPESESEKHHLEACLHCQAQRKLMQLFFSDEMTDEEAKNVNWIVNRLERNPVAPVSRWRSWFSLPRLSAVSLAMASLLVVISVRMATRQAPSVDETSIGSSTFRSGAIKLNEPLGDVTSAPRRFTWELVAGATNYRVKLMEVDDNILWTKEINTSSIAIPDEVRAKIVFAKTLLWQVEATDASGKAIASSSPQRFRVVLTVDK